ncbi:predicted protein [Nematostella vectensis]|uniref:G-protein coupled receptors family 1 profile domain-containing protein n=1 Tax=Nematostella vectensis TaxID=45351 RepID=A7T8T2_NEMVE|nr:predicted protein [Nematostella vectensis]|eukprot:XP_001619702.1 hypothetical protein NEMVEDRAFT_v1g223917 [Nematostella vectensis]
MNASVDDADTSTAKTLIPLQQVLSVKVLVIALNSILGVLTIAGNVLVLYVKRQESRPSPASACSMMRYFVMSLALSDILASLISLPVTISQMVGWFDLETDLMCKVVRYIGIVGPVVTTNNLLVMGLTRYACAFHPLKVPSRRTIIQCIIAAWITGLLLSLLPASAYNVIPVDIDVESATRLCRADPSHKHLFLGFSVCGYIIPCVVLTFTSLAIARFLRRKSKQVCEKQSSPIRRENAWQYEGNKMLISVTFAMILPYFTFFTYQNMTLLWKVPFSFTTDRIIRFTMNTVCYANGLCNVLIYFYYMKNLRTIMKRILGSIWCFLVL